MKCDYDFYEEKPSKKNNFIPVLIPFLLGTLFVGGLVFMFISFFKDVKDVAVDLSEIASHNSVIDTISSGIVSNKEIVNSEVIGGGGLVYNDGKTGYYYDDDKQYIPTRYRIHITFEYEYEGETYQGSKYYDVSDDIYCSYNIGDYFDTKNLTRIEVTSTVSE